MTHHEGHDDETAVDTLPDQQAADEEERPSQSSPNPTQRRIDEDPDADKPADAPWNE
jgi:hypothetical protein